MHRRRFLTGSALSLAASCTTTLLTHSAGATVPSQNPSSPAAPIKLGAMIRTGPEMEKTLAAIQQLNFSNCFLSANQSVDQFSSQLSDEWKALFHAYGVVPTAIEVVVPGPLSWDFQDGPSTIGLVPPQMRAARIQALKRTSDFARLLQIPIVQTHGGFLPENPKDPLYRGAIDAIAEVSAHCASNHQSFLLETGQETPITLLRAIKDVNAPNLGVGMDTANLILYGKSNPVDALDILGPYVGSVHAKDGNWPTDPMKLGEEVVIGKGRVDFRAVFQKLMALHYTGPITIEREISGPQQYHDLKEEKTYLSQILHEVLSA